jgi:hypothetical protein
MTPSAHNWPVRLSVVAAVAVGAGTLTLLPGAAPPAVAEVLVPWTDCDALLGHYRTELAGTATPYGVGSGGFGNVFAQTDAARVAAPVPAAAGGAVAQQESAALDAVGSGPTGTNVQERGVDEPDTVKAADGLLFVAARGRLQVLRAGAEPELLSSLPLGDQTTGPAELLVDGDRVLALVSGWRPVEPVPVEPVPVEPEPVPAPLPDEPLPVEPAPLPVEPAPLPDSPELVPDLLPDGAPPMPAPALPAPPPGDLAASSRGSFDMALPAPGAATVTAVLVDVAEPTEPRVVETLDLDGRYVSARLVDGAVRLVTSSTPVVPVVTPAEPYGPGQEQASLEQNRRAARDVTLEQVLPRAVRRDAAGAVQQTTQAVQCASVHRPVSEPQGSSTLLVTTLRPSQGLQALDSTAVTTDGDLVYASPDRLYVATSRWGTVAPAGRAVAPDGRPTTDLHAFDTSAPDSTRYVGSGAVPGYVYGRWALSAHEGHLRVATTLQPPWDSSERSSSSVTVLAEGDGGLSEVGRVDGLGVDERIYAVRYFGDLATVVTFRQTDPLYVLDLADPAAPKVLGELKIPGFSTYLHPVGDDRLLGIGQDADASGRVTGFQVSLFDLSDLSTPVQVDRLSLGQGWSPAQEESRAVAYDPSPGLLALPYSDERGRSTALGVRVAGDGLEEAGRLDVTSPEGWGVERVLLVDGVALAVTQDRVVAADVDGWVRTGTARLAG